MKTANKTSHTWKEMDAALSLLQFSQQPTETNIEVVIALKLCSFPQSCYHFKTFSSNIRYSGSCCLHQAVGSSNWLPKPTAGVKPANPVTANRSAHANPANSTQSAGRACQEDTPTASSRQLKCGYFCILSGNKL